MGDVLNKWLTVLKFIVIIILNKVTHLYFFNTTPQILVTGGFVSFI